jgi:hypothetical protein
MYKKINTGTNYDFRYNKHYLGNLPKKNHNYVRLDYFELRNCVSNHFLFKKGKKPLI